MATQGGIHVDEVRTSGTRTLTPEGELDLATVGTLEEALDRVAREAPGPIVLDLRRLEFMDSSGIHLLLRLRERYDRDRLTVRRPTGSALRVVELAEIDSLVRFTD